MNVLKSPLLPRLLAGLAMAGALAGCAENKILTHHVQAAAPDCPAGPAAPAPAPIQLGCANKANLAAMVADPSDLVRGRPETPAVGARQAAAVEAYKKGQVKSVNGGGSASGVSLLIPSSTGNQ